MSNKRTPFAPLQSQEVDRLQLSPSKASAYHLTPLEVKNNRLKQAKEFGLSPPPLDPFLHNQSLPPSGINDPENGNTFPDMGEVYKASLDKFRGDTLDSISFSPLKNSPTAHSPCPGRSDPHHHRHLNGNSSFIKRIEVNTDHSTLHSYVQNPNKAIVTINAQTTEILTANKSAFSLLGLKDDNIAVKLKDFIHSPEDQYLFTEADLKPDGELVLFSGKVMDMITSTNAIIPVSVWARQLCTDGDYRCLVVMEPVERVTGKVEVNFVGLIIFCDESFSCLFGFASPEDAIGIPIHTLMPTIKFAENVMKTRQCITGRTRDGSTFPLCIRLRNNSLSDIEGDPCFADVDPDTYRGCCKGVVWVFSNISGLITLLPDGTIHSCNTNFSLILFGYSQNDLVGKNISFLIPSFYDDVEYLDTDSIALPPFDDDEDSNTRNNTSDGRTTADSTGSRPTNPLARSVEPKEASSSFQNFGTPLPAVDEPTSSQGSPSMQNQLSILADPLEPCDSGSKSAECDSLRNDEKSASTPQGSSSNHLSCSESQDTLHSSTNSITESDLNANVIDPKEEFVANLESVDEQEDYESDNFSSESSEADEDEEHSEDCSSCGEGEDEAEEPLQDVDLCSRMCGLSFNGARTEASPKCCTEQCISQSLSDSNLRYSSTPRKEGVKPLSDNSCQSIPEGDFVGDGRHRDGTILGIEYSIKKVQLEDGKVVYCLWVSRDPDEIKECSPVSKKCESQSQTEETQSSKSRSELSSSSEASISSTLSDSQYIDGSFAERYTILHHIGKGAFGCIKRAFRKSDGLVVITKFIRKSEVYKDLWVDDINFKNKVPLEVSLLTTLKHPNIVRVLDVFENDLCFQMVMERFGSGMDLFEFIDRAEFIEEPLASHIFRQIVSAVSYLDDLSILHRDIKDENVIINQKFHVKLIDFGSATFMREKLFTKFCGTIEYCSPEVIRGEKYKGPELEMFSLGVTLYTLTCGENPFVGADEILEGNYKVPSFISEELSKLIAHLLEYDPTKRCTLPELKRHPWIRRPVPIKDFDFQKITRASFKELNPKKYVDLNSDGEEVEYVIKHRSENDLAEQEVVS